MVKPLILLWLALIRLAHSLQLQASEPSDIVQVVYRIITDEDREHAKIVDFHDFSSDTDRDFTQELFRVVGSKVTIEAVSASQSSSHERPWNFNVITVDSLNRFKAIKFADSRFNYGGFYVILCESATRQDSLEIFGTLWHFYIRNVNLIRRENGAVIVETFFPFQPNKCNQTESVEIARYVGGKFTHRPMHFFPNKFRNFHKCPIRVTTFETIGPAVLRADYPNGTHRLYGRDIEIFDTITERLNFSANIFYNSTYGGWGAINVRGEGFGAFMSVKERSADLTFGNLNMKLERAMHLGYIIPYSADTLLFMIPPGRPLGTFEKLLRPFDKLLWIVLCCVLAIATLTITILELQSRGIRDFVIGRRIKAAYLNILIAVIGGSQSKLPRGNFGRFLLMIFLLFCLVLRTLYQGSLFHFLQSSDTAKDPETIQAMAIERNYTFYMIISYSEFSQENVHMRGKIVVIDPLRIKELMARLLEADFQGSMMLKISQVLYSNRERAMRREQLFKVCKEYFMVIPITMYFPKHSYLIEPFNDLMFLFQQAGLLGYWTSINEDMTFLNFRADANEPKKLTLKHMSGPFQIWLVGCLISGSAFLAELLWRRIRHVACVTAGRKIFSMGEIYA